MTVAERMQTDNEKYGSGFLESDEGGAWLVLYRNGTAESHVSFVAANRTVAESYIHDHVRTAEHPDRTSDDYSIQVWAISDTWPDEGA